MDLCDETNTRLDGQVSYSVEQTWLDDKQVGLFDHTFPSNSLLKILFSFTADSVFRVYRLGAEVIWIACDAINWPVSKSLVMLGPSGFAIGRDCRRLP